LLKVREMIPLMSDEEIRKMAEDHWEYTKKVIVASSTLDDKEVELCHMLYVESMIHGFKHGKHDEE
jgi:hypothetical protein